jgi:amino acid adenylation domain-containing protein
MTEEVRTLSTGFIRSRRASPNKTALEVGGRTWTYDELYERATALSATLLSRALSVDPPLAAVFASRSVTAFAAVLGILMRGHGYVPLNYRFPVSRTKEMLRNSGCRAMIVDEVSENQLNELLQGIEDSLLIIIPERSDVSEFRRLWPHHVFLGSLDLENPGHWVPQDISPDSIAYILYTSGSTGVPKGVMVNHRNMIHFIDVMLKRFEFSQINELTFDVSTFDMFVAWEKGCTVCVFPEKAVIQPGRFIQTANLTLFYGGPSLAIRMKKMGMAKPNQYPGLRYTFFAGEALPVEVAEFWQRAAPNSIIENLYGPTELTVTCTYYRYHAGIPPEEIVFGWVPIGEPHPGMNAIVVDDQLRELSYGHDGELLMSGPQVALGYWRDPERTKAAFVIPPGKNEIYYRTGDRVRRDHEKGPLLFLGRTDHQVQVQGFRVELGEVEAVLREEAATEAVAAVGWPITAAGVGAIVAFIGDIGVDAESIISRMRLRVPSYMVPRHIYVLPELPLNPNRKVDRKALVKMLETLG